MSVSNILEFKPRKISATESSTTPTPQRGSSPTQLNLSDPCHIKLNHAAEMLHYYRNMAPDQAKADHILEQMRHALDVGRAIVMVSGDLEDELTMDVLEIRMDFARWFSAQPV